MTFKSSAGKNLLNM